MTDNKSFDSEVGAYLSGVLGRQGKAEYDIEKYHFTHYFFWDANNSVGYDICYCADYLVAGRALRWLFVVWDKWNITKNGTAEKDPEMKFTKTKMSWAKVNSRVLFIKIKKEQI